ITHYASSKARTLRVSTDLKDRLLHVESLEHVRGAGGEAEAGIAGGHAEQDAGVEAHRAARQTGAEPHRAGVFRADGRRAAARARATVDLADDLHALFDRARDGEPVVEHVVLVVTASRVAEDAEADVAHQPDRADGLADEHVGVEVGRVETEA